MKKNILTTQRVVASLFNLPQLRIGAFLLILAGALLLITGLSGGFCGDQPPAQTVLFADGKQYLIPAGITTVAETLRAAKIVLRENDRVEPALDQPLAGGEQIRVTRVDVVYTNETVTEPHKSTILNDSHLRPGTVIKARTGQDGKVTRKLRIWKRDGVETMRDVMSQKRLQRRIDAIEIHGARTGELPSRGGEVRRCMTMVATGYDPGPRSCGKYADGYTAIGMRAGKGVVAVDPRVIRMRTPLYIEGYGFAIAGDVGGAIKGARIDLGFDTYNEALHYGRRTVKVYILD